MKKQKQTFKKKVLKILLIILSLATVYSFAAPKFINPSTAYAVGDLTIDWGVPTGDPIFTVVGMMPGDVEFRDVDVTNNASIPRTVAVRGVETSETLDFSTILDFVISDTGGDIYGGASITGPKTLAEFFVDSGGPEGLDLSTLGPGDSTTYTFTATFPFSAGNEFQNASVVFDLIIGISSDVPPECEHIVFNGSIIFGTQNDDNLHGTNYNDLIIGLEGKDKINGSNGDDCIVGNEGNDKLDGSNGNDIILGGDGDDYINGGSNGNDYIDGGSGNDKIDASNGNDKVFGGEGNDKIDTGNGNDYVIAGSGNDYIDGSNGNDYIEGNEGDDEMLGKNGNDTLLGGPDVDKATGGLGTDTCDAETEITCEL